MTALKLLNTPVCIIGVFISPAAFVISLKVPALVLVISIPLALFAIPIIPLFKVFGSISNSGALWQALHPKPPVVLIPAALNTGAVVKSVLP